MRALVVLLVAAAAVAAASRFGMLYGQAVAPESQASCCQDGVPVCSQLSWRLGIPDLGCELVCRQRGLPGSLGCTHQTLVPSCGCRSNHTAAQAGAEAAAQTKFRLLPTGTLSRTRFS